MILPWSVPESNGLATMDATGKIRCWAEWK